MAVPEKSQQLHCRIGNAPTRHDEHRAATGRKQKLQVMKDFDVWIDDQYAAMGLSVDSITTSASPTDEELKEEALLDRFGEV